MLKNIKFLGCIVLFVAAGFISCGNFLKYGSTYKEAKDTYMLIDVQNKNFGYQRLMYNKAFYKCELAKNFFCAENNRRDPDFIFEYINENNLNGIEFFYVNSNEVFVFELESKWGNLLLKNTRPLSDFERKVYQKLKKAANAK
ncbi:hypothetical protein [Flavobacterium sp.]|uniref:hypothetical protein n=1 Tax=Flavobacterium sp. TaxID=239 RepID=UPI002637BC80|nr:hypothetical protein [Flavobacterium sp.]